MGPSASLDAVVERKISSLPGFKPITSRASSPQPITILTEVSQLLWHMMDGINCETKIWEQNLKVTGSANETTIKYKLNWLSHSVMMSEDGIASKVFKYNWVRRGSIDNQEKMER